MRNTTRLGNLVFDRLHHFASPSPAREPLFHAETPVVQRAVHITDRPSGSSQQLSNLC